MNKHRQLFRHNCFGIFLRACGTWLIRKSKTDTLIIGDLMYLLYAYRGLGMLSLQYLILQFWLFQLI
jgi:hypothetical protein